MRKLMLYAMLAALGAAVSCAGKQESTPRPVALQPGPAQPAAPEAPRDAWEALSRVAPLEEPKGTKYFAASDAPPCPRIDVLTAQDKKVTLSPGTPGFVTPGDVTLVVFWSMDSASARMAARHVSDLVRKYAAYRVRAVGIVARTAGAGASHTYADRFGLAFPLYFDDLSALEEMSEQAGAKVTTAIPSVFIVDRKTRLRFHRVGFGFVLVGQAGTQTVSETAPENQHIEDYLKTILGET